jgi:predicted permease
LFSVLALALGLGLNGALLVLSRTFLLRPAPVSQAASLFELKDLFNKAPEAEGWGSTTVYQELGGLACFQGMALTTSVRPRTWNRPEGGQPVQVCAASHEYLPLLGLHPFLGRNFQKGETGPGAAAPLALVSYRFWKGPLASRPDILGSLITLDGKTYTVVGVLPRGFEGHGVDQGVEVMVAWVSDDAAGTPPPEAFYRSTATVLARLKPGVSIANAAAALKARSWGPYNHLEIRPYHPMPQLLQRKLSRGLAGLHGAALLILAIALANVLALQTARLHRRLPELALRTSLGAGPGQLFRLILLENLVISLLAGGAALVLAAAATPFLEAIQALLPYPPKVNMSFGLWTSGVTLLTALVLGVLLAWLVSTQARNLNLETPLKEGRSHSAGWRLRGLLVAIQAALALVLLCSALLCVKDLKRQLDIPLGMELRDRYLLECQPRKVGLTDADLLPILPTLRERLRRLPGVQDLSLNQGGPVRGISSSIAGQDYLVATHNLPSLMGMALEEGRYLESGDEDQPRALVSSEYAHQHWPGEPVLGKTVHIFGKTLEVVGVLKSVRFAGPTSQPQSYLFTATSTKDILTNIPLPNVTIRAVGVVKGAIHTAARAELKDLPFELNSLEELRDKQLSQPRQLLYLASIMGALALLLSVSGLYGFAAHLAVARKREMGIRVVMGAGPGSILAVLAKGSLMPVIPGLAAGALLAYATSRVLVHQGEVFPALSGTILVQASLLLAASAAIACLVPALSVLRNNPAESLRNE